MVARLQVTYYCSEGTLAFNLAVPSVSFFLRAKPMIFRAVSFAFFLQQLTQHSTIQRFSILISGYDGPETGSLRPGRNERLIVHRSCSLGCHVSLHGHLNSGLLLNKQETK